MDGEGPVRPSWVQILSMSPHFLFVRNRLHSASLTFPEFQKVNSNSYLPGKGGNAETKEKQSRNNSAKLGRVLFPPQGTDIAISLSSSAGTKAGIEVQDVNSKLSTRFLEHCPVTSPPTNQKKVCTQWKIMNTLIPS